MTHQGLTRNPEDPRPSSRVLAGRPASEAELVSVVIPCYNQAHFLGEAIESVLAQTHPFFEVVVVDDGSADDTSAVAARYPGVRCVRQENQGPSAARNTGISHSKGDYLVFLDADDRLVPEALEVSLGCLRAHPECALASGRWRPIAADGASLPLSFPQHLIHRDRYAALLERNYIGMPAAAMHRRSALETVGGFPTFLRGCEDYDLYLRVARMFPVYYHDGVVAEYRKHGAKATGNHALMLSTAVSVLRSQREHVRGNAQYEQAYRAGLKFWRDWYGDPLVERVRAQLRKGEWGQALRGMRVLLRYYPQAFSPKNERRRLARQLEAREWRLQEASSALEEERRRVRQLRQRNRQLRQRTQDLQRQLQTLRRSRAYRLLRAIGSVRDKMTPR